MLELPLDRARHLLYDSAERQPGHDVSEKTQDDQTLRLVLAQPSAQKIEEILGIELADRRTVRAPHVVGLDLEVRERVGSTFV